MTGDRIETGTCVDRGVLVRDSADPDGGRLALSRREFVDLLAAIKRR